MNCFFFSAGNYLHWFSILIQFYPLQKWLLHFSLILYNDSYVKHHYTFFYSIPGLLSIQYSIVTTFALTLPPTVPTTFPSWPHRTYFLCLEGSSISYYSRRMLTRVQVVSTGNLHFMWWNGDCSFFSASSNSAQETFSGTPSSNDLLWFFWPRPRFASCKTPRSWWAFD
jgi:hypothetical protein